MSYTGRLLAGVVERLIDQEKFDEHAMRRVLATKFEDWEYEKEVRVFAGLQDKESALYFTDFEPTLKLREVILGARFSDSPDEVLEAARAYAPKVTVTHARLAFRSFRVIGNKAVHLAV